MPFLLYRIEGNDYVIARSATVRLGGRSGPFCCAARLAPANPEWELTELELVGSFEVDPAQYAIIIDLAPDRETVNLYRLRHVWGYSADQWTRVALQLEALYANHDPTSGTSKEAFKERFPALSAPGDEVYEFLYLNGDGSDGNWSFGSVGGVNAPLLRADVLDSFMKRINRKRIENDHVPPLGDVDLKAAA